jgi:hypothetical protein
MNATKANYGIYGDGTTHAVFQARNIVKGAEKQGFEVTYGGNLYVYATESHFAQGHDGDPTHPFIAFSGTCSASNIYAPNFESGKPSIKIGRTGCNPGFEGDDGGDEHVDEFIPVIRVMGEDLSISDNSENYEADFDFNDVVFDVTYTSETTATITLQAAGGTLPLTVAGRNVHDLFNAGETDMINTGAGVTRDPVSFDITCIHKANRGRDIEIKVKKNGEWVELMANKGVAAAKIAVKPTFEWCEEYLDIQLKYPKFKEWVQDKDVIWY